MYGGRHFEDFSQHPGIGHTILSGPNQGSQSTAAGRYQFLLPTWNEQAKKYGYKDFSPETQDTAAWNYANDVYRAKTGGDLATALQSGDAGQIANVGKVLSGTWTSLPGGIEQSTGADQFVTTYQNALGNPAVTNPYSQTDVAATATDVGSQMATAEGAAEGDPMSQLTAAAQLMGKGSQPKVAAPAPAAPVVQARPVDPFMTLQTRSYLHDRRRSYG